MKNVESDSVDITSDIKNQLELGAWKFTGKTKRGIYKIVNTNNGNYYVGSAANITRRLIYYHLKMLISNSHYNQHLQNAWNKHGENAFRFYVVEEVNSQDDLLVLEQKWLDIARREKCYNKTFIAGRPEMTANTRNKISRTLKRYYLTHEHPLLGTHPSPETLEKLSKSHIGKRLSDFAKEKISGVNSVAHRESVKTKKKQWWIELRKDPIKYSEFCKGRAKKSTKCRYGDKPLCEKL